MARGADGDLPHEIAHDPTIPFTPALATGESPSICRSGIGGGRVPALEREWDQTQVVKSEPLAGGSGQVFWPVRRNKSGGSPAPGIEPEFFAASTFAGSVPGRVYKMGPHGLGYYVDRPGWRNEMSNEAAAQWIAPKDISTAPVHGQQQALGDSVLPEQQASLLLRDMLRKLPSSAQGEALGNGRSILQVIRELQIHSTNASSGASKGVDAEVKHALADAIKWALTQVFIRAMIDPMAFETLNGIRNIVTNCFALMRRPIACRRCWRTLFSLVLW